MTNDAVVTIMIKKIQCTNPFEFADTLFYSILCGEQDLRSKDSSSCAKLKAAEKFFKPRLLSESYVFIPINRSLHWLLAVLTPWHMIFMDSMTWNVRTRQTEADHINNFLEHLYKKVNFSEYQQLPLRILKVPQQMVGSNNCGIYICMFIEMFLKVFCKVILALMVNGANRLSESNNDAVLLSRFLFVILSGTGNLDVKENTSDSGFHGIPSVFVDDNAPQSKSTDEARSVIGTAINTSGLLESHFRALTQFDISRDVFHRIHAVIHVLLL
ncbi:uncharacterized protein LOC110231454 [Exaiptasia diaphana]|uniref:Ubiquitin-like protease family profile domain-containing protein n=1 Tax=Exaiptasia diaphana TaxID=2652724 RepID=A0A913YC78_EXADI|nr:uncharacterized protein LOC110231454 [Exaiptasia diaphana]